MGTRKLPISLNNGGSLLSDILFKTQLLLRILKWKIKISYFSGFVFISIPVVLVKCCVYTWPRSLLMTWLHFYRWRWIQSSKWPSSRLTTTQLFAVCITPRVLSECTTAWYKGRDVEHSWAANVWSIDQLILVETLGETADRLKNCHSCCHCYVIRQ